MNEKERTFKTSPEKWCYLKREGASHSLWCNPSTGWVKSVLRHIEIPNKLVRKICMNLSITEIG